MINLEPLKPMRKWVTGGEPSLAWYSSLTFMPRRNTNCNSFLLVSTMLSVLRSLAKLSPRLVVGWVLVLNLLAADASWAQEPRRPFYEDPGDYRQQINQLKDNFKAQFGYELLDLELGWKPDEIKELTLAFSKRD